MSTIKGIVEDINGTPIDGAEVSLREINGSAIISNITNKTGHFQLDNIQIGEYGIYCKYKGKEYFNVLINITSNTTILNDMILPILNNQTEDSDTPGDDDTGGGNGSACDDASGGVAYGIAIIIMVIIIFIIISLTLYSRIRRHHLLNHETRARIRDHIVDTPGDHFSAIKDKLELSTGVLNYHIERLEKERFVTSRSEGKFKCFYPPGWEEPPGIRLTPVQESILAQIRKSKGISQSEVSRRIGRNRKVVNYNVHQLRELGLVDIEKDGRETRCFFVRNA